MRCPWHRGDDLASHHGREACVKTVLTDGRDPRLVPKEELDAKIAETSKYDRERDERMREAAQAVRDGIYRRAVQNMKSIMLVAGDGSMKPLLDFTLEDVRSWKKKSRSHFLAWAERRKWFKLAEQMLTEAGVEVVHDLPTDKIRELAEYAEDIWKDKAKAVEEEVAAS